MRAISLWQPWASAVALGIKRVETRSWATTNTGPVVIHAAKRWTKAQQEFADVEFTLGRIPKQVPLGALVATAVIMGCRRTEDVAPQVGTIERLYGDYRPGRYAWFLDHIKPLPTPIPWLGAQGFFAVPDDVVAR